MPISMAPRVALVHDFLLDLRGAERVFAAICNAWPEADVYTAVYDERGTEGRFADRSPRTSFLQGLRPTHRTFRSLLPLYPVAIESLDLRGYDIVISSSSAWAHGVLVDPGAVHVCYCHNPFRYAWSEREATLAARPAALRLPLAVLLSRWRQWDWIAAQRVDRYVANSALTATRLRHYFGRDAEVLHPPVELERFAPGRVRDHYLVVAELMAHKRIDIAVHAFTRLRRPLTVVGDGPEMRRLRRLAGPTVRFTGRLPDTQVAELLRSARALVVTASEELASPRSSRSPPGARSSRSATAASSRAWPRGRPAPTTATTVPRRWPRSWIASTRSRSILGRASPPPSASGSTGSRRCCERSWTTPWPPSALRGPPWSPDCCRAARPAAPPPVPDAGAVSCEGSPTLARTVRCVTQLRHRAAFCRHLRFTS
jgi:glycosyl transferase family 4/glycosyl transferase family 1